MNDLHERIMHMAHQIAGRLSEIDGVVAVVLGGSWARGEGKPNSDIDLGLYYTPENRPSLAALRALAAELDDSHSGDVVTDYGEWGRWINGGAWLTVEGQRVDWLYKDLAQIRQLVARVTAGETAHYYQAGHPFGFAEHIYASEIALCQPLVDPQGVIAELKAQVIPYPPALKARLIGGMWEASFSLDIARKTAARGDSFYVAGCLFRCASVMAQALFALNETYWMNEKGSIQIAGKLPLCPPNFEAEVMAVLGAPGTSPDALAASIARFEALVSQTRALCGLD